MDVVRIMFMFVVVAVIYIANVESQSTTNNQTTLPPTTKVVASETTGNPQAQALVDKQTAPPANATIQIQPKKRVQVKRRKQKRRLRKKRPPTKNGGNGNITDPVPKTTEVKSLQTLVIEPQKEPEVKSVMAAQVKVAVKTKPVKIAQRQPKLPVVDNANTVKANPETNSGGFGQDMFFDMFSETTTVQSAEAAGPPPDFDVNKVPATKVVPTVDTKNAKAYDGSRKSTFSSDNNYSVLNKCQLLLLFVCFCLCLFCFFFVTIILW